MRMRHFLAQNDPFGSDKNFSETTFTLYNFLIIPYVASRVKGRHYSQDQNGPCAHKKYYGKTVNITFMYHFQGAKVGSGPKLTLAQSNKKPASNVLLFFLHVKSNP